ncbi:TPA: NAD-dependent deacetylase [Escherichia coli]|nr:NAD-dependent deacetylase [Escherichia coli]
MLSRRGHRLSRFRKNKRRLRERLRQRIKWCRKQWKNQEYSY